MDITPKDMELIRECIQERAKELEEFLKDFPDDMKTQRKLADCHRLTDAFDILILRQ